MKYILLIGGILLALLAEFLEKENSEKKGSKKIFKKLTKQGIILIISGLLLSCLGIYQTYKEDQQAKQDRITIINKNRQDSLRQEKIIFNTNKQLTDALAIYKNTEKSLHPFFPLTLTLKYSIPFNNPEIKELTKYLLATKKQFDINKKPSHEDSLGWYNGKGPMHRLNSDYTSKLNSIQNYDSFMGLFEISLIKGTLQDLKSFNDSVPQMHFEISGAKNRTIHLEADFDSKYVNFLVTYKNIQYIAPTEKKSNTIFGSNELLDLYILVNLYTNSTDEKILREIKFHPTVGHLEKCFIRFSPDDIIDLGITNYFIHKIVSKNFTYWDEDLQ